MLTSQGIEMRVLPGRDIPRISSVTESGHPAELADEGPILSIRKAWGGFVQSVGPNVADSGVLLAGKLYVSELPNELVPPIGRNEG